MWKILAILHRTNYTVKRILPERWTDNTSAHTFHYFATEQSDDGSDHNFCKNNEKYANALPAISRGLSTINASVKMKRFGDKSHLTAELLKSIMNLKLFNMQRSRINWLLFQALLILFWWCDEMQVAMLMSMR